MTPKLRFAVRWALDALRLLLIVPIAVLLPFVGLAIWLEDTAERIYSYRSRQDAGDDGR